MPTRYRVALQGFNESERGALALCLQYGGGRDHGYEEAADGQASDLLVADADAPGVPDAVRAAGRLRDTVFVGAQPVPGALSQVPRPIDADAIARELGELVALRRAEVEGLTVEVGLPLDDLMPRFEGFPTPPPSGPTSIERFGARLPAAQAPAEVAAVAPPVAPDATEASG
ncbi:MAG TPA: hypothetical protein VF291_05795, partial [Burkholderiaceae bacterium]